MPKPADLSVTGLRRRYVLIAPRTCQAEACAALTGEPEDGALLVITPAGFERYFARIAAERQDIEPPKWGRQPIPEVTVLGPPLSAGVDPAMTLSHQHQLRTFARIQYRCLSGPPRSSLGLAVVLQLAGERFEKR